MELRLFALVILCFVAQSSQGKESGLKLKNGVSGGGVDPSRATRISWSPRAFLYRGFLTDEECDYLINLVKDSLERSTVVDDETGKSVTSEYRTSRGKFLARKQDEIVGRIEARIAAWTFIPVENGEDIQILRYEKGEKYDVHADYVDDDGKGNGDLEQGGNRVATILMYLSNVDKGGETVFPNSQEKHRQPKGNNWSRCATQGYAVKPRKGDALLFFSLHPNATTDPSSMHGACPVIEGKKWSATKWVRVRPYRTTPPSRASDCVDEHPYCSTWALAGECENNQAYMVGSNGSLGYCRKSCRVCSA